MRRRPILIPTKRSFHTRKQRRATEIRNPVECRSHECVRCVTRWITVPFHTDNIDGENRLVKTYQTNASFQYFIIDITELHLDALSFGNVQYFPHRPKSFAATMFAALNQSLSRCFESEAIGLRTSIRNLIPPFHIENQDLRSSIS